MSFLLLKNKALTSPPAQTRSLVKKNRVGIKEQKTKPPNRVSRLTTVTLICKLRRRVTRYDVLHYD